MAQSLVLTKYSHLANAKSCKPQEISTSISEDVTGHGTPAQGTDLPNGKWFHFSFIHSLALYSILSY